MFEQWIMCLYEILIVKRNGSWKRRPHHYHATHWPSISTTSPGGRGVLHEPPLHLSMIEEFVEERHRIVDGENKLGMKSLNEHWHTV